MASATLVQDCPTGNTCPVLSIVDGRPVASSFKIAEHFEKPHRHVLRDIKSLMSVAPECAPNFGLTSVLLPMPNGGHRRSPAFDMDRDGFTLLAMGFTGTKALAWKIRYIQQFNTMETTLKGNALPSRPSRRKYELEMPATVADRKPLGKLISVWVGMAPFSWRDAWTQVHAHFGIDSIEEMTKGEVIQAVAWVESKIAAIQKALPAATPPPAVREPVMPTASEIDGLVAAVKFRGSEMHNALDNLWTAIWPDYGRYGGDHGRFVSMSQLRYVSEDIFKTLVSNIESCRRIASTISVNYRELCRLRGEHRQ